MKYLILLVVLLTSTLYAQTTTVEETLNQVASKYKLELCFSKDRVDLSDSIIPPVDSLELSNYLKELSRLAQLDIQQSDKSLIVTSITNNTLLMSGKMVDAKSGETLPFAHILQKDWGTGTITNEIGQFEVNVPQVLSGLELQFSCMGYADTTLIIPQTDTLGLIVKLRPKPYNLNEVLVLPNGNTAKELVRQATKKIKRNYHRKTCQMEAFYRQTGMRDTTFVNLIEAALLIEDKGIDATMESTKIKVEQMRRSTNYLIPRDKKWELASKYWEKIFGHRNIYYKCYNRNSVRNYKSEWWYRPLVDLEKFDYEFEGALWLDTMKVYKVKYTYTYIPEMMGGGKRKTGPNKSWDGGYIYINSNDLAIVKLDYIWQLKGKMAKYWKDGILSQSTRSYQKIDGKYYLKYIKGRTYPNAKSWVTKNPDNHDEEQEVESQQWAEEVLVVTNIITEKKQQERIRFREKLARDEKTLEKKYPYDPHFWANYNMVKLKPLPGTAIIDLEWDKSLELQFEENGEDNVESK
ncbi:carboxypeptidase-like regulatory domain-containing protein [Carboxylicivirga sp. N1Y90]|uniref:carboxypeptidase-like regulatory domain-containing protein n=1 Tax=Carboxylicivirga fragile TaxID=3417571 RepID=UPI003D343AA6|nr:carboxypeptidase-like regulatory domain-containing protein [Marinilabiliaceae bacterium N1Y90]